MACVTDVPANWRLRTNSGIPYKFIGMKGNFGSETASIDWTALFRSVDLIPVMKELFPGPIQFGNITIPQAGVMPGAPGLVAQRATFKSQDDGKPIDPLSNDLAAIGTLTYHPYIEVTVTFAPNNKNEADPDDPRTFLEVSSQESYEVLYTPPGDTKLADETNSAGDSDEEPGDGPVDPDTGEVNGVVTEDSEKRTNQNPTLPCSRIIPTTEWSVRWRQVPYLYYRNVVAHRLRLVGGRVNSQTIPFLYGAAPETVLFAGHSTQEVYSWRDDNVNAAPIDLTLKFIEKRIVWRGIICGHNHIWEPGKGWKRAYIGENKDEPLYRRTNMNFLFKG